MGKLLDWLFIRLREPSTWRGIVLFLATAGVTIEPALWDKIIAVGIAVMGLIEFIRKEKPTVMIVLFLLSMLFAVPQAEAIDFTFPQETGATMFYFPSSGTFAAGMTHTFARASMENIPVTVDADGVIAKEITQQTQDLYGLGIKANVDILKLNVGGVDVLPNIGAAFLNNFRDFTSASDLIDNFKLAIYGTVLMYKW